MRLLITAGPTREPLDPVRYLSNRSSGRMGYALAAAAQELGHTVVLVSGPVNLPAPGGTALVRVETAQQMYDTVAREIRRADIAIFAAAVADYRPVVRSVQKIKKSAETLTLELEPTPDILGSARTAMAFGGYLVGFAAETENVVAHAQDKLTRKQCDLIVANDVSQPGIGFDSAENEVTLCLPGGQTHPLPRQSKANLARALMAIILDRAAAKLNSPL
jgi:phosphopantothenoylcysteine synthetase/decarboxylase